MAGTSKKSTKTSVINESGSETESVHDDKQSKVKPSKSKSTDPEKKSKISKSKSKSEPEPEKEQKIDETLKTEKNLNSEKTSEPVKSTASKSKPVKSDKIHVSAKNTDKSDNNVDKDWENMSDEMNHDNDKKSVHSDTFNKKDNKINHSIVNFSYDQILDVYTPVNETSDEDLMKILIARSFRKSQHVLCKTLKQTLRASNSECDFPGTSSIESLVKMSKKITRSDMYNDVRRTNSQQSYRSHDDDSGRQESHRGDYGRPVYFRGGRGRQSHGRNDRREEPTNATHGMRRRDEPVDYDN